MAHIAHLPPCYRAAIETIDASAERTESRLRALCEHWATVNGYTSGDLAKYHPSWVEDAVSIASKRFWNFKAGV